MKNKIFILLFVALLSTNVFAQSPKYEFRGVWIATVNNIDWPSKPGLSVQQQKYEAIQLLNTIQEHGMNAIFFQARPCSDAFYKSNIEPWSRYLTGTPGKDPGYDPMAFWIDEAHKRGLEFHAWINPFRIAQNANEQLSNQSIVFARPDWVVTYGGKLYLNPALEETKLYITNIVKDIARRYNVDAIHIDDYFYPYPVAGENFPDDAQFNANPKGFANKADWRRHHVDETISILSAAIKEVNPKIKFGVSPFGVWRNNNIDPSGSNTKAGITNYDDLYADVPRWLRNGWIDYLTPQIYWELGHPAADYQTLIDWWSYHSFGKAIYVGHALYKIDKNSMAAGWRDGAQVPYQIQLTRSTPNIQGSAFYSAKHLNRDLIGLQNALKTNLYKYKALVPPMPWIDNTAPSKIQNIKSKGKVLSWDKPEYKDRADEPIRYLIYKYKKGTSFNKDNVEMIYSITTKNKINVNVKTRTKQIYCFRISSLDKFNNESELSEAKEVKL